MGTHVLRESVEVDCLFYDIDMVELDKMVEYCMNHGANYFDTAYMYVNSQSETAMGKVLKKYKREDFILADKKPIVHNENQLFIKIFYILAKL